MNSTDNEAKYQIFISSTYEDLAKERSRVIKVILRAEQIPIAMEHFVASDKSQWDIIQRFLRTAGCMTLILGDRYGSIESESGKSYTEREYDFAKDNQIPILAFVKAPRSHRWRIPRKTALNRNNTVTNHDRLREFIDRVKSDHRLVCLFKDEADLAGAVASSIYKEKNEFNNPWVCSKDTSGIKENNLALEDLRTRNYWNDEAKSMYEKYIDKLNKLDDKWDMLPWEGGKDFKYLFEIRDDNNMIGKDRRAQGITKSIRYVWTDGSGQMLVKGWYL